MNEQPKSDNKELALASPPQQHLPEMYIPSETDWNFMVKWGSHAMKSGLLPVGIKSSEAAAIIVLKGRELGITFMTAISHIHIINGKPCMSAELIQGLARKNLPGLVINILQSDAKIAKIEFIRPERGAKAFTQSFSWEEATNAKLTAKDVWKSYPVAMLWSRCVTAGLRKVCPEALMGISYTPEELGANVDGEGNIIETTGRHVETGTHVPSMKPEGQKSQPPTEEALLKRAEGQKIKQLKAELAISNEELKAEAHRLCGVDDFEKLSLEQIRLIVKSLEDEKKHRAQSAEVPIVPQDENAPWLQESMGPVVS